MRVLILFLFLLLTSAGTSDAAGKYSGSRADLARIDSIIGDAERLESDRSILWIERGYLSNEQSNGLHRKIDKAIVDIETFIGINFDTEAYKQSKIEFFVYRKKEPSHTITGYQPRKYMHPVIFLTFVKEGFAPYLHEAVHIIAWDWNSLWIKEGLAVFLNDELGGGPAFPNRGKDIDVLASSNLNQYEGVLPMIGRDGIPKFSSRRERWAFYVFAGSFVKYLHSKLGTEKLMAIYPARNTREAILSLTGISMKDWKRTWISTLK